MIGGYDPPPTTKSGRAVIDVLAAGLWSSTDADRILARLRPADFPPLDDTIAAAIMDLRRHGITWRDPMPVLHALDGYRQLWRDRLDSGKFGLPTIETPIEDVIDPDRWPLRFAGRVLQTGRIYDVMRHIPVQDLGAAIEQVAARRRHEVAEATMHTVQRILADPGPDTSRAERQQAVNRVLHDYRRDMNARHLFPQGPQHGPGHGRDSPTMRR